MTDTSSVLVVMPRLPVSSVLLCTVQVKQKGRQLADLGTVTALVVGEAGLLPVGTDVATLSAAQWQRLCQGDEAPGDAPAAGLEGVLGFAEIFDGLTENFTAVHTPDRLTPYASPEFMVRFSGNIGQPPEVAGNAAVQEMVAAAAPQAPAAGQGGGARASQSIGELHPLQQVFMLLQQQGMPGNSAASVGVHL